MSIHTSLSTHQNSPRSPLSHFVLELLNAFLLRDIFIVNTSQPLVKILCIENAVVGCFTSIFSITSSVSLMVMFGGGRG